MPRWYCEKCAKAIFGCCVPQRDNGGRVWLVKFAESQSALTDEKKHKHKDPIDSIMVKGTILLQYSIVKVL